MVVVLFNVQHAMLCIVWNTLPQDVIHPSIHPRILHGNIMEMTPRPEAQPF